MEDGDRERVRFADLTLLSEQHYEQTRRAPERDWHEQRGQADAEFEEGVQGQRPRGSMRDATPDRGTTGELRKLPVTR